MSIWIEHIVESLSSDLKNQPSLKESFDSSAFTAHLSGLAERIVRTIQLDNKAISGQRSLTYVPVLIQEMATESRSTILNSEMAADLVNNVSTFKTVFDMHKLCYEHEQDEANDIQNTNICYRLGYSRKSFRVNSFYATDENIGAPIIHPDDWAHVLRYSLIAYAIMTAPGMKLTKGLDYFRIAFRVYSKFRKNYLRVIRKSYISSIDDSGRPLQHTDIWDLNYSNLSSINFVRFDFNWRSTKLTDEEFKDLIQKNQADEYVNELSNVCHILNAIAYSLNLHILHQLYGISVTPSNVASFSCGLFTSKEDEVTALKRTLGDIMVNEPNRIWQFGKSIEQYHKLRLKTKVDNKRDYSSVKPKIMESVQKQMENHKDKEVNKDYRQVQENRKKLQDLRNSFLKNSNLTQIQSVLKWINLEEELSFDEKHYIAQSFGITHIPYLFGPKVCKEAFSVGSFVQQLKQQNDHGQFPRILDSDLLNFAK